MASPITQDGFAHASWNNVADATIVARLEALGFNVGAGGGDLGVIADQPRILDYAGVGDFDKHGEAGSNSWPAFRAMIADCNDNRVIGLVTPGNWRRAGSETDTAVLMQGAGLSFTRTGWDYNVAGEGFGNTSAQILVEHGVNRLVPPFAMHSGSILENPSSYYCDVIPRLLNGDYTIDASAYPTITGAPEEYAPFIVGDFVHNDAGDPGARNVGGVRIANPRMLLAYAGIHFGDPNFAEEAWATDYTTGDNLKVAGPGIEGRYEGFCLKYCMRILRSGNLARFGAWSFGGSFVALVQQMADVHGIPGNDNPLIRWTQRNGSLVEAAHKFVGGKWDYMGARNYRRFFKLEPGAGLPPEDAEEGAYVSPDGFDAGKIGHIQISRIEAERVPIILDVDPATYCHAIEIGSFAGHFMDHDDRGNTDYLFEFRTDKTKAGAIQKRTTYITDQAGDLILDEDDNPIVQNAAGDFKPQGDQVGWTIQFGEARIQELAGGLYRNTAEDGTTHVIFSGGSIGSWGQGAKQGPGDPMPDDRWPLFVNLSPNVYLHHTNCLVQARESNKYSNDVYCVVDPDKLMLAGNRYFGCDQIVVGAPDFAGYAGCFEYPLASTVDEDGEDDDGDRLSTPDAP